MQVSIPHRYDPNRPYGPKLVQINTVSIPHRYDPNDVVDERLNSAQMFQFLIGTIQTMDSADPVMSLSRFNSS